MGVVSGKFAAMLECSLAKPDSLTRRVWNQNYIQFCHSGMYLAFVNKVMQ